MIDAANSADDIEESDIEGFLSRRSPLQGSTNVMQSAMKEIMRAAEVMRELREDLTNKNATVQEEVENNNASALLASDKKSSAAESVKNLNTIRPMFKIDIQEDPKTDKGKRANWVAVSSENNAEVRTCKEFPPK